MCVVAANQDLSLFILCHSNVLLQCDYRVMEILDQVG